MEHQVMRLPRYARGLTLVRFGMFAMLLCFVIQAYVVTKVITMKATPDGINDLLTWTRYGLWANLGAIALMLLGTLVALPDFLASKESPMRLAVSALGFGVATVALLWSNHVLTGVIDVFNDPDASLVEVANAVERVDNTELAVIVRDLAYPVGVVALLRSIRQTAVANDHYALRDASSQVSSMCMLLAVLDVGYQLLSSIGVLSMSFMFAIVFGIVGGLALIGFWVYVHLRLAKFLKAAAILVHEPHNLPVAKVIVRGAPVAPVDVEPDIPVIRQSGPNIRQSGPLRGRRPSGPIQPSAAPIQPTAPTYTPAPITPPVPMPSAPPPAGPSGPIMTVAAELRAAPVPRAETAPGAPVDEPKLLR